jgi:uncharacterized protein (DUF2141 family)
MLNLQDHTLNFNIAKKENLLAIFRWLAATFLLFISSGTVFAQNSAIKLHLKGLRRQDQGILLICLFQSEKGFPEDGSKAYRIFKISPSEEITLDNIPRGKYALSLLHDLDQNGEMSYNLIGIPKDGFSSSPDGGPSLKKASFKSAAFQHGNVVSQLQLKVHYLP